MEDLFKERKKKLRSFKDLISRTTRTSKKEVPTGMYVKCDKCGASILNQELEANMYICPSCGTNHKINSFQRMALVFDEGSYRELYKTTKFVNPLNFPGYEEKIKSLQETTGLNEGVLVGVGKIDSIRTVVCAMDNRFIMASMGSIVGDKITCAIEYATKRRLPLIIFCSSGGARMQEGIFSLMQMAKTSAALKRHSNAGLLYISYITHPTYGGVSASFAPLGDIIIGEPDAKYGFAGERVIESTIKQTLPEGFQTTEFNQEHGFIDVIVDRKDMKKTLGVLLNIHCKGVK